MRLAVINSCLALVGERGAIDVAVVSAGKFSPDTQAIYQQWAQFSAWYAANSETIRAAEAGLGTPESGPVVFAKFPSSITGPAAAVELPSEAVDYEAELVVVIGKRPPHRPPGRVGTRRRPDPRSGPVRAAGAVSRADPAVLAEQVLPGLLPHRAGSAHPRRVRRSGQHRNRLHPRRAGDAKGPDRRPNLQRPGEHHRVALLHPPIEFQAKTATTASLQHSAYTFDSIDALLERYTMLRDKGITPAVCIAHGVTTSMYYQDPDRNFVELQIDRFAEPEQATAYMLGPEYATDSVGPRLRPQGAAGRPPRGREHRGAFRPVLGAQGRSSQPARHADGRLSTMTATVQHPTVEVPTGEQLVSAYGASSFAGSNPLQRIWRDSAVAARNAVTLPAVNYEVYGMALLGRDD